MITTQSNLLNTTPHRLIQMYNTSHGLLYNMHPTLSCFYSKVFAARSKQPRHSGKLPPRLCSFSPFFQNPDGQTLKFARKLRLQPRYPCKFRGFLHKNILLSIFINWNPLFARTAVEFSVGEFKTMCACSGNGAREMPAAFIRSLHWKPPIPTSQSLRDFTRSIKRKSKTMKNDC
jgi:hypothetical protein